MLTKYNRTIVATNSGAVVPEAVVEFRYQFTGALAPVYSDVNGSNAILNPTTADENGFVGVFLNPGIYRIIARQVPGGPPLQELTYELVVNSTVADPQALSALGLNPHGIENISILFEPEAEGLYVNVASRLGAPFSNENYSTVAFRTPEVDQDSSYVIVQIDEPLEVLLENSVDFGIGATGQQWMFVYLVWDGDEVHIGLARKTIHDEGVDHTTLDFSSNDVDRILTDGAISTPCTIRLVGRFVATRSSGNWSSVLTPSSYQSETTFITQEARKLLGDYGDFQFSGNLDIDGTISSGGSLVLTEDQVGVPNGIASLNALGQIPSGQLPSYVDDVLEFASFAALPVTGESGKIYITVDDNEQYRWTGSTYVQLVASPGTTDNVPEGSTNLYFTQARVRSTPLTGFVAGVGLTAVLATDTILQAFQKLQGWLNGLGTAALANVTTSASDTTSGRLWRTNDLVKVTSATDTTSGSVVTVGYAGWGGAAAFSPDTDLNNVGNFSYLFKPSSQSGVTNLPPGWDDLDYVHGLNTYYSSAIGAQLVFGRTEGMAFRQRNGTNTYGIWRTIWDTANLTKATSNLDTTPGNVALTGYAGWGILNPTNETNANNLTIPAQYQLTTGSPASFSNYPSWAEPSRSSMMVLGNMSPYGFQLYFDRTQARAAFRGYNGGFGSWREFWTDATLVKTVSPSDVNSGRMLQVGDGGLLGRSIYQSTYDVNSIGPTIFRTVTGNSGTKPSDNISGFPDNVTLLPIQRSSGDNSSQVAWALSGSTPRMAIRHYDGISWRPWVEVWSTGNLVKTTSDTDNTPGSMLKVGDGGLLGSSVNVTWANSDYSTFKATEAGGPGIYACGIHSRGTANTALSIAGRNGALWHQSKEGGVFGSWLRVWDTGNTSTAVQELLGIEDPWAALANQSTDILNPGRINSCIDAAINDDPNTVKSIRQTVLSASISLAAVHNGRHIVKTNTSAYTITLQLNSSVPLPIGFNVTIINDGSAGNISITRITGGIVLRLAGSATNADRVIAPYGQATLIKIGTDTWRIVGVGVT